jgi:hypothetical protein
LPHGVNASHFDAIISKGLVQMRGGPPKWLLLLTAKAVGFEKPAGQTKAYVFEPHQIQQKFVERHALHAAQRNRVGGKLAREVEMKRGRAVDIHRTEQSKHTG